MASAIAAKAPQRKDLTGPALRTFFRIADAWGLTENEQMRMLGLDKRSTYQSWKRGSVATIPKDALERISYVIGIYKGLQILLPWSANDWVRKPNKSPIFGGRTALDRMTSGNVADLYVVRQSGAKGPNVLACCAPRALLIPGPVGVHWYSTIRCSTMTRSTPRRSQT